eukprot:CAMPEP_0183369294 /NCGR_PEP_ID=MMETSP0164_2-20130417/98851_1 /TAXON_ID=221442 /ORGANISM="Coccolithus pelagicus ssp braarudi, Strain PLY182g" /LENGTH=54 /DNA_ID=CAMNT_0025545531 /DNA_START=123 /DNA_END=283 /DNA_ORIENTATION=-
MERLRQDIPGFTTHFISSPTAAPAGRATGLKHFEGPRHRHFELLETQTPRAAAG